MIHMTHDFEKSKKDEIPDFPAERGNDPTADPERVIDPDRAEEKRAEAARMREEAEVAKAEAEAAARKKLRELTTIKDAQPSTGSAELPHFATAPQEPQGLLARIKGLFRGK